MTEQKLKVLLVEKEEALGVHASGRNSGVIHPGFYYSPESLKAKFCRNGNLAIRATAREHSIAVRDVGKVVAVRNEDEFKRLQTLFERGKAYGVQLDLLVSKELSKFEPLIS